MRDIINEDQKTCMERDCKLALNGKEFESGGAFIGVDKDGIHGGVVYGDWKYQTVSNWHGDVKIQARYGFEFRGGLGDRRRHVWFAWKGIRYHGVWCSIDWSQIIRVREVKGGKESEV